MDGMKQGAVAVIFISRRNGADADGYAAAAAAMDAEAARQPGYLGMDAVRDAQGEGITISYWADEAAALAWRAHAGHSAIRDRGRAVWYDRYRVIVGEVTRSYRWERAASPGVAAPSMKEKMMADPTPEDTTGQTMLEKTPPKAVAQPAAADAATEQDELIESTAVQGAADEEQA